MLQVLAKSLRYRRSLGFFGWAQLQAGRLLLKIVNRNLKSLYLSHRPDFDRMYKLMPARDELALDWITGVEDNNEGDFPRLYAIYLNLQACLKRCPQGAMAELGVYKGNSAKVLNKLAPDRKLYLFDTFSGFTESDVQLDPTTPAAGTFSDTSLEKVRAFVGGNENVKFCPGHFPETSRWVQEGECFSFVHLDCDLYAPTAAALEFFYPRMVPGGIIMIHDYNNKYWPGVSRAVDEFLIGKPESPVLIPDKSGTAIIAVQLPEVYEPKKIEP